MSFILFLLHLYFLNCLLSLLRYAQLSVYNICISVNEEARNCKGSKGTVSISGFLSALLPADSGDKLNYSLTVLLGFIFAQTIIAGSIPKVSRSPALAEYVMQAIVLCAANLGACCFLTYLYKKPADYEPPQWIKIVFIRCIRSFVGPAADPVRKKWSRKRIRTRKNNKQTVSRWLSKEIIKGSSSVKVIKLKPRLKSNSKKKRIEKIACCIRKLIYVRLNYFIQINMSNFLLDLQLNF